MSQVLPLETKAPFNGRFDSAAKRWLTEVCGPEANSHTRSVILIAKLLCRSPVRTRTGFPRVS